MINKKIKGLSFFEKFLFYLLSSLSLIRIFSYLRYSVKLNYLYKKYKDLIVDSKDRNVIGPDYKTFIFWWDGIDEKTPLVVKTAVKSIMKNGKNVILITKNNYKKYANIPDFIIKKLNKGVFSLTHFSDILRSALLYKNGGLWLDATVYLDRPLEDISNYSFYSPKLHLSALQRYFPSRGKWAVFVMAAAKNSKLMLNTFNLHCAYWKDHDSLIDYYLMDYFILLQYRHTKEIKKIIDSIPYNNPNMNKLNLFLPNLVVHHKYDKRYFDKITSNTRVCKLTYKYNHKKYDNLDNTYLKAIINKINDSSIH